MQTRFQGSTRRFVQRRFSGRDILRANRTVYSAIQRQNGCVCLCGIGLYQYLFDPCHADFQRRGYADSPFLQKDQGRSRRCVGTADHDDQRFGGSRDVLRHELAVFDQYPAISRLNQRLRGYFPRDIYMKCISLYKKSKQMTAYLLAFWYFQQNINRFL